MQRYYSVALLLLLPLSPVSSQEEGAEIVLTPEEAQIIENALTECESLLLTYETKLTTDSILIVKQKETLEALDSELLLLSTYYEEQRKKTLRNGILIGTGAGIIITVLISGIIQGVTK